MIGPHVAMLRFGIPKDDPDSPFDDTKCQACGIKFGLALDQVVTAPQYPELCRDCYDSVMNVFPEIGS